MMKRHIYIELGLDLSKLTRNYSSFSFNCSDSDTPKLIETKNRNKNCTLTLTMKSVFLEALNRKLLNIYIFALSIAVL